MKALSAVWLFLVLGSGLVLSAENVEKKVSNCGRYKISSPPAGTKCGVTGTLSAAKPFATAYSKLAVDARMLEECRDYCFDMGFKCQSFSVTYDTNKECVLYSATLDQQGFKAGSSPRSYHSRFCYDESCTTVKTVTLTDPNTNYDDKSWKFLLPFFISIAGIKYPIVEISTNGVVAFPITPETMNGSSYVNVGLPYYSTASGSSYLPEVAVCGYWDDLFVISQGTQNAFPQQEVSYSYDNLGPYRQFTVNWKTLGTGSLAYLDMEMVFSDHFPNTVIINYNRVIGLNGSSATIGFQSKPANKAAQYAYNRAGSISRGTSLIVDTLNARIT